MLFRSVGMRGAGKSSLARRIGSDLRLRVVDTDQEFQKKHGDICPFIATHGWEAFRREEAAVIQSCLQEKDIVLACGGGAVETPAVRAMLKKHAIVLWVQASEEELCKRLSRGERPRLTDLPLREEVRLFLEKRTPFFREVSTFTLSAHIPFSRQVPVVQIGRAHV